MADTSVTNEIDSGLSSGGTTSTLQDSTKSWQVGALQGAFLFLFVGSQVYQTTITANKSNELTVVTLPISVTSGLTYSIRQPASGNKGSFTTGKVIVATAGVPVQLPDIPIPWGTAGILMAYPANGGHIFFANSQANILKTTPDPTTGVMRFEYLSPGDSIPIHESNLNAYWIDTDASGSSVVWKI